MGVPGLWDILRPAGEQRSLTHLAVVDGFEHNPKGLRGLRIGIDASIWFYHAAYGKEGENPELRTLFFRCARLLGKPFLPLFVFDGPKRPKVKRGKRIGGKDHWLTSGMQRIIEAFGFEWRMAPGEAEAELAYLNRIGVIDAIISDDVDTFLFGASMIIRNPSKSLSGNRPHIAKGGLSTPEHVIIYTSSRLFSDPSIQLTHGGLILIGLLRGGDYHPEGLPGCGTMIAHGLARCGFGDQLVDAVRRYGRGPELDEFLVGWREEVRRELRTDSRGLIGSKRKKLAEAVTEEFPDMDVLLAYTNPVTSEREGRRGGRSTGRDVIEYQWAREADLGRLAGVCELFFEWGVKEVIVKRFRTVLWAAAVLRLLRKAVLDGDARLPQGSEGEDTPGTPSKVVARQLSSLQINSPSSTSRNSEEGGDDLEDDNIGGLIVKIHSKRTHASTDDLPEYRLEVDPASLVRTTEAGVKGIRPEIEGQRPVFSDDEDEGGGDDDDDDDEGGTKKKKGVKKPPPDKNSHLRVWMPECMVKEVAPGMVREFEEKRGKKKAKGGTGKGTRTCTNVRAKAGGSKVGARLKAKSASKSTSAKSSAKIVDVSEDDESEEDFSEVFGIGKAGRRGKGKGTGRRRVAIIDEESEEEAEDEEVGEEEQDKSPSKDQTSRRTSKSKGKDPVTSAAAASKRKGTSSSTAKSKKAISATAKVVTASRTGSILDLFSGLPLSSQAGSISVSASTSVDAGVRSSTCRPTASSSIAAPFPISFDLQSRSTATHTSSSSSTNLAIPSTPKKSRKKSMLSDSDSSSDKQLVSPSPKKSPRKNKTQTSPQVGSRNRSAWRSLAEEEEEELDFGALKFIRPLDMAKAKAKARNVDIEMGSTVREKSRERLARRNLETEDGRSKSRRAESPTPSKSWTSSGHRPAAWTASSASSRELQAPSSSSVSRSSSSHPRPTQERNRRPLSSQVTYVEISSDSESDGRAVGPGTKKTEQKVTSTKDLTVFTQTQMRPESKNQGQNALTERTNVKTLFDYMSVKKTGAKDSMISKTSKIVRDTKDVEVIDLT